MVRRGLDKGRGEGTPPDPFQKQIDDHVDFLSRYGDVRSHVPTQSYREGWDRIFSKNRGKR